MNIKTLPLITIPVFLTCVIFIEGRIIHRNLIEIKTLAEAKTKLKNNIKELREDPKKYPIKNIKRISSSFGERIHPVTKKISFHTGIDIPALKYTTVISPSSGIVEETGKSIKYGNFILIDHNNTKTKYGHLNKILVEPGEKVKENTPIGLVGSTGRSTGNHLHWEIIKKDSSCYKDPEVFLK